MGREVVDGGVLVEVVGCVGLALGDGEVADVVIGVGFRLAGNQLVADIVAIGLRFLRGHHGTGFGDGGTAAEQVVGVGVLRGDGAIDGVGDADEQITRRLIIPFCGCAIGIGEAGLQVRAGQIFPRKIAHRGEPPRGGVVGEGVLACAIHAVSHVPAEGVVMAGEGFGVETAHLFGGKLAEGIIREGGGTDGIGGGGLAAQRVVGVGDVGSGVGVIHGEELAPVVVSISGDDAAGVGTGDEAAIVGVGIGQPFAVDVRSVSEFIIDYHLLKNKKNDRPKSPMSVETGKGQYSTR